MRLGAIGVPDADRRPAETDPAEARVAATPETVKKFIALGASVAVEAGAGLKSSVPRQRLRRRWRHHRARPGGDPADADIILRVRRPSGSELAGAKKGALRRRRSSIPYGHVDALNNWPTPASMLSRWN